MSRKIHLDRVHVVDIEATCWEDQPPEGQENEIIEIGLTPLYLKSFTIGKPVQILVRPTKSEMSDFCTELTGLTQERLDKDGIGFDEAVHALYYDHKTHSRAWGSWGDYDRGMFERMCRARELRYPFNRRHTNIKALFAQGLGLPQEVPTHDALEILGWQFEGTPHLRR